MLFCQYCQWRLRKCVVHEHLNWLDLNILITVSYYKYFFPLSQIIIREPFYKFCFQHKTRRTMSYACEIIKDHLHCIYVKFFDAKAKK